MKKIPRTGWLWGCLLLAACSGENASEKDSNELAALSHLREFQTANVLFSMEHGRFAGLSELYQADPGGAIGYKFFLAWDGHAEPRPLFGYIFASIDPGYASDRQKASRAGLCAYPAKRGETGDLIICTLSSPNPAAEEEQWRLYVARAGEVRHPPRTWPSEAELNRSFERVPSSSAEQGISEARGAAVGMAGG